MDLFIGSIYISPGEIWTTLFGKTQDPVHYEIIINYRLPKALTAVLVGSALSVAGLLMQTLFANPLAGPDVLGVNSGAGLGVAVFTLLSATTFTFGLNDMSGWGILSAGITGAVCILFLILITSIKITNTVSLLIVGIMFGNIAGAVISILQSVSNPDSIKLFIVWTFGSLSGVTWMFMKILAPLILIGLFFSFMIQKQMDSLLLGENYAKGLGINIFRLRFFIILITALLAGSSTAFAGPIAFIGVTVPHIARGLFNTSRHRIILPASLLCGASLLVLCDIISQLPGTGFSVPINAVCALFGAPMIIWIIFYRQKSFRYF
ncbi:MAG: iron ABC transporter permease [Candidatus Azobacteroides sp.]|nr:iron ABC transporter permease [Candidatus Azobacteroides sp.]